MHFSFYGKLTVEISDHAPLGYLRYFENEYRRISSYCTSTQSAQSIISIDIVDSLPEKQPGDILQKVKVKNLLRFEYIVRNAKTNTPKIIFCSHKVGQLYPLAVCVYLQSQVLEPLMYAKLIERDVILLHAAGVTRGKSAFLFPAEGGTGKTSLAIGLLDDGFKLLGDDLIFVDVPLLQALPYPRPLHLFEYNLDHMGSARLPFRYRATIRLKNFVRFFLERVYRSDFLISTRVHADELFTEPFGESGSISAVYFLTRTGPEIATMAAYGQSLEDLVDRILESSDLRRSLGTLLPPQAFDSALKKERGLTRSLISSLGAVNYLNVRSFSGDIGALLEESSSKTRKQRSF